MPVCGLNNVASGRTSQIRVVHYDAMSASCQFRIERGGKLGQRTSRFVAVQTKVPTAHVVICETALPCSWDANEHDHLCADQWLCWRTVVWTTNAKSTVENCSVVGRRVKVRSTGRRAGTFWAPRAWDCNHNWGKIKHPSQGCLGRGRAVCPSDIRQRL
jgi:hypothetical protein